MTSFYPAKEIVAKVHVGSKKDSQDSQWLKRHNITLIVNCTRDLPNVFQGQAGLRYVRVPIDDSPQERGRFLQHIRNAVLAIHAELQDRTKGAVLVHCFAGVSRSASTVAAYLMARYGMKPSEAMQYIRTKKPETFSQGHHFIDAMQSAKTFTR